MRSSLTVQLHLTLSLKVVEKYGPFSLTLCQMVALMLPHRSVFVGLLLVAILLPPLLK
ncbi:MAG TPA: hypothetical protein VK598_06935 [Nitrospiraceae bacterium]|nr:hypothetical protein [Nitrospiraceae bacterium]